MQPHVLYEIPVATVPVRVLMGSVSLLFVVGIFGFWLPRGIRYLRRRGEGPNWFFIMIWLLATAIGFGPLLVLISLISNPLTVITERGVIKESAFFGKPMSLAWSDIDHVDCQASRGGARLRSMMVVSSHAERIEIGNASGVDIYSVRELLKNQLGVELMHNCRQLRPQQ